MPAPPLAAILEELEALSEDDRFEMSLGPRELAAVLRGLRAVEALGAVDAAEAAAEVYEMIADLVVEADEDEVPSRTETATPIGDALDKRLEVLRGAILERKKVEFGYSGQQRGRVERTVRPLGLTFLGRDWELLAWCELREAFRTFRLGRIDELVATEETFPIESGRRIEDFRRRR